MLSSEPCYAVVQRAFQILWQCYEAQSLGITRLIPRRAYIRNFLLGWHPMVMGQRYIFFGPGLWAPVCLPGFEVAATKSADSTI